MSGDRGVMPTCRWCGKRIYPTRRDARRAAKRWHAGERMSPFQCWRAPKWAEASWHIGHFDSWARRQAQNARRAS